MPEFDDIRPYRDDEVRPVVTSLVKNLDLSRALAKFKYPRLYNLMPGFLARLTQVYLKKELKDVHVIHDVQIIIEKYLDNLIESTTTSLTHDGLDKLDPEKCYLFISNHRDISMDPALVNYMLYHDGFDTLQIATGDNLFSRPFLSDIMKLNKSFIVKRNLQGREKLKASKQLSSYIHYCIRNGENVWIAQREGRAKDGIDKTESAIIKMLHLANREVNSKLALNKSINSLNIVPVTLSYEFDPCDGSKAEELQQIDTSGKFEKQEGADVQSILDGMTGNKGAVHVSFGSPIELEEGATAEDVIDLIDEQIVANYRLHPVNYLALEKLQEDFMDFSKLAEILNISNSSLQKARVIFEKRLQSYPAKLHPYLLNMYANPVKRKFENRQSRPIV